MSTNKILFSIFTTAMLCSCSSDVFVSHNGNMPTNDRISQLKPGQSKEEVLSLLGAPSSVVSLDKNTWIYMSSEVKQVAFFKPTEIDRDVLTIKFDKYDQVADIDRLNKKNGTEVAVSTDATQTLGQEPGFFERFFGGVGTYMPFAGRRQQM